MPYKKSHIPNVRKLLSDVEAVAQKALFDEVDAYAEDQRDEFVERIEQQRFAAFRKVFYPESGTNLSPNWIKRKTSKGADLRTMIATGHYIDSIKVHSKKDPSGKKLMLRIGFHPATKARDLDNKTVDITLDDIAKIHEHGNSQTPARPHWGPNYNRMKREVPKLRVEMRKRILKKVKKAIGSKLVVKVG